MKDTRAETQKPVKCSIDAGIGGSDMVCRVSWPGINDIKRIRR